MRRRTLLATIPTVMVAGCSSTPDDSPTDDAGDGASATPSPTRSPTPTATDTPAGVVPATDEYLSQSRAVRAMDATVGDDGLPELTVFLHEDPVVPGASASEYVELGRLRVADAYTRSWGGGLVYPDETSTTVTVDPPGWPARGLAAAVDGDFEDPFREEISFEVAEDATVTTTDYRSATDG